MNKIKAVDKKEAEMLNQLKHIKRPPRDKMVREAPQEK